MQPPPVPFEPMLIFGSFAAMLILGVLLRATVPFLQKFLMPSCLIGGIIGLVLISLGVFNFSSADIKTFAYHFFNISFISVGLTGSCVCDTGKLASCSGSLRSLCWPSF